MSSHDAQACEVCQDFDYESFRHRCVHETMEKSERWAEHYGLWQWERWDYELEQGRLVFSHGGRTKLIAEIEVAGTVQGQEWQWAWGNRSLPEPCRSRIGQVLAFGILRNWSELTELFLETDEYLGSELALSLRMCSTGRLCTGAPMRSVAATRSTPSCCKQKSSTSQERHCSII